MALFKISKGAAKNLAAQAKTEGYCWFTPEDGKFYIDTVSTNSSAGIPGNRICLNAAKADVATKLASAATINGVGFDGSVSITNYGVCGTPAATAAKTVTISNFKLVTGARILVKFNETNTAATPTLNVSGTGAKPIKVYGTLAAGTGQITNGWKAGAIVPFTYDGTNWVRDYWENTIAYTEIPIITSSASTAAKTATCSAYTLASNSYFSVLNLYTNTAASAITLNINGAGAKPIYINGTASSASNHSLPAGPYIVYYNGTNYYFRTDGGIQGGTFYGNALTASTASKLSVGTVGDVKKPVYFENGIPKVCSGNINGLLFRGETVPGAVAGTVKMPAEITAHLADEFLLQVYQNGVLLSAPINYSVSSDKANITLNGYSCEADDIFTFILISDTLQGLDSSVYATKDFLSAYVSKLGDTMSGSLTIADTTESISTADGALQVKGGIGCSKSIRGNKVFGAVWNDYAEYRICDCLKPGKVVCENGDDTLSISNRRLQPGANIISDTFGFAIGETQDAKCPIAVSGRVLAYPAEFRDTYQPGDAVCAGPNGTVSRMTREEIKEYPERIIGIVSAIPSYEFWGESKIAVDGRIWIKVK